jgi:hypothetical protein
MKFNFKKIASVVATTVMLGSTIAAAYPAPFVEDGIADAAVVYGANAALSDASAAIDLMNDLNTGVTSSGGEATITGGDFLKLERSGTDLFNMGENMNRFYASLDEGELSVVLTEGVYMDDNNDEHDFDQKIEFGADLNLSHFVDSELDNDEVPYVGFDFSDDTKILNYTLDFIENVKNDSNTFAANLGDTEITMLGRTYYIASASWNSAVPKLTLLDTANTAIVTEGETQSLVVEDTTYDITMEFIDASNVILSINGIETNKLQEGDVYKVEGDTYVAVKNILYNAKDTGISKADISLGSGKIVLTHGSEVEINNVAVNNLLVNVITDSSLQLDKISIEWRVDDDAWLVPGTDMTLPGFETIKLSMGDFIMPKSEVTTIKEGSNGVLRVSTELVDGPANIDILYLNTTNDGFSGQGGGINRSDSTSGGIGYSYTKQLLTTNSSATSGSAVNLDLNETHVNRFVVTWINGDDAESYYFELDKIEEQSTSKKNKTTLNNLATGGSDIVFTDEGDDDTHGQVKFTLVAVDDNNKTATISFEPASAGTAYADRVITKEGLQFKLPVSVVNDQIDSLDNTIFLGNTTQLGDATWTMNLTEEDENGNIAATNPSRSFTIRFGLSGTDGLEPNQITGITTHQTEDGSNVYEGYMSPSALGTYILYDTPTGSALNSIDVTYAGEESYAEVFISEALATVVSAADDGTKVVVVKDSEVSSVSSKNLVVVGGSCINTVAAEILGSESPICGEAFSEATNVAAGQYLIKTVVSPYATNKVAMLVAGYDAEDTVDAVAKAKEGVDATAGTEQVYPMATA